MKTVILDDWNRYYDGQPNLARLRERSEVAIFYDHAPTPEALIERLRGAAVVCANRERSRFPASVLEPLPELELISQSGGAGRHIDLEAATRLGIAVATAPGAPNSSANVAELGLALLLALARDLPAMDRRVRQGDWTAPVTDTLFGKTLGIIGLGKIGRHMAAICQAMGLS